MARKKTKTAKTAKAPAKKEGRLSFSRLNRNELLSSPQSYRSLFFGVATVIILFLIGFGITRLFFGNPTPDLSDNAVSTESIEQALNPSGDYTVKEGDTLWSIAEEELGSGFEWQKIAVANNITDATVLEEGTMLVIPGTEEATDSAEIAQASPTAGATATIAPTATPTTVPTVAPTKAPAQTETPVTGGKITGASYTVKPGDYLWDIAVRAYGDGYKWVEIARLNNLENPDLIYSGNQLKLPR